MERKSQIGQGQEKIPNPQESKTDRRLRRVAWTVMTVGGLALGLLGTTGEVVRVSRGEFGEPLKSTEGPFDPFKGEEPWTTDAIFISDAVAGAFIVGIAEAIRRKGKAQTK